MKKFFKTTIKKDKITKMYTLTLKAEVKGQTSDFDYDVVVTYRNIKTVRECDAIVEKVADTLFRLNATKS